MTDARRRRALERISATTGPRPQLPRRRLGHRRGVLLAISVAAALAALFVPTLLSSHRQPCTHGESSAAVAIYGGHVHVLEAPHQTGCTP